MPGQWIVRLARGQHRWECRWSYWAQGRCSPRLSFQAPVEARPCTHAAWSIRRDTDGRTTGNQDCDLTIWGSGSSVRTRAHPPEQTPTAIPKRLCLGAPRMPSVDSTAHAWTGVISIARCCAAAVPTRPDIPSWVRFEGKRWADRLVGMLYAVQLAARPAALLERDSAACAWDRR